MHSKQLYSKAKQLFPLGVSSPVRAFSPYPIFVKKAKGSKIYSVENKEYIDYCMAFGPLILGHANDYVIEKVKFALENGTIFGTPSSLEIEMAKKVKKYYKTIEMLRFVNTGTEATMHAIRLARAFTKKDKIIKVVGGFHGSHDAVLVKNGRGALTQGIPSSVGVPKDTAKNTIVIPYNNVNALENAIKTDKEKIACFILEPILGNIGVVLPRKNYLREVRKITQENGIVLIFDEVITGFRVGFGGCQEFYGVEPDLTTLGKIVGGGMPLAIYGGRKEIMENVAPLGKVYQAGTFSGNPISLTSGIATIEFLEKKNVYEKLNENTDWLVKELKEILQELKLNYQINNIASMFQIFFTEKEVYDYKSVKTANAEKFMEFFRELLKNGIYLCPSQFETNFLSYEHSKDDLEKTVKGIENGLKRVCK